MVEHRIDGKQVRSVYGHMVTGSAAVSIGDQVKPGRLVGLLGNTGASTGAHLHLENIVDGVHVDPQKFLQKYADGKAVDVFGEAPVWNPPSGNSTDEGEGWSPEQSDSYVAPAVPVIETPAPPVPSAPDAGPRPQQPAPENPPPVDPAPSTPASSGPTPSGNAPAPADGATPAPPTIKEATTPEPQETS